MSCSIFNVMQMSRGQEAESLLLFHLLQEAVNTSWPPPEESSWAWRLAEVEGPPGSSSCSLFVCSLSHQRFKFHLMNAQMSPCALQTSKASQTPSSFFFFCQPVTFLFPTLQRQRDVIERWCHFALCCWEGISNGAKAKFPNVSTKRLFQSFPKQRQTDILTRHACSPCHKMCFNSTLRLWHILRQNLKNKSK